MKKFWGSKTWAAKFWASGHWTGVGVTVEPPQPLYRPRTAVGPDGYRPGGAIVAAGHRPLFARRGTEYRPGNPTSPGG